MNVMSSTSSSLWNELLPDMISIFFNSGNDPMNFVSNHSPPLHVLQLPGKNEATAFPSTTIYAPSSASTLECPWYTAYTATAVLIFSSSYVVHLNDPTFEARI
jgi:hypothetical protein